MKQSLLILPFRNLSFSAEDDFLSDGLTEELIASITKQGHLQVASRTTSFYFKGKSLPLEEIRQKLEVTHLLEGSIRRDERQLRITVHLTEIKTGFTKWSETFDFKYNNLLAVQKEIAAHITKKITPTTQNEAMPPSVPNNDMVAYEHYLKGLFHYNRYTVEQMQKGVVFFEKAIRRQPDFALAHAGLAHGSLGLGGYLHPSYYRKAKEAATKAIALDSQLLEPHLSLVYVQMFYDWDWQGAERSIQKGLDINLRSALAHRIKGVYFQVTGRPQAAVEAHEIATKYDPLDVIFVKGLARSLYLARKYDEAMDEYKRTLELDPTFRPALEGMGFVAAAQGNWKAALQYFHRYQEMTGHPLKGWFGLGLASGKTGNIDLSYEILKRLDKRKEENATETLDLDYAMVYLGLGQLDHFFSYLNNAVDKHHIYTIGILLGDPVFDEIRTDQRYRSLIEKLGLDQFSKQGNNPAQTNQLIKIQSDTKEQIELFLGNLFYIEADGNYSRFVFREGKQINERLLRITLSGVKKQIGDSPISQVHRSFLVNLNNMDALLREGRNFNLVNNSFQITIPVSRQNGQKIAVDFSDRNNLS